MKLLSARSFEPCKPAPLLPPEIIDQIISFLDVRSILYQPTLYSCCLVSRAWYSASIPFLYAQPRLSSKNFEKFASTLCPPIGSHAKIGHAAVDLAIYVKHLDMGSLIHCSSKSLTARLLRRVRGNLESFLADATSFSINSFASLSKCHKLRDVNLTLIARTENQESLISALADLPNLTILRLPRYGSEKPFLPSNFFNLLPNLRLLGLPQESLISMTVPSRPNSSHSNNITTITDSSDNSFDSEPFDPTSTIKPNHPLRELEIFYGRRYSRRLMMQLLPLTRVLPNLHLITFMGSTESTDVLDDDADEAIAEIIDELLKKRGKFLNQRITEKQQQQQHQHQHHHHQQQQQQRGREQGRVRQKKTISEEDMGIFWEDA